MVFLGELQAKFHKEIDVSTVGSEPEQVKAEENKKIFGIETKIALFNAGYAMTFTNGSYGILTSTATDQL